MGRGAWWAIVHKQLSTHTLNLLQYCFLFFFFFYCFGFLAMKKEIATHSSTLAWKIPWTEEPGRLQSMGSQRVRHN